MRRANRKRGLAALLCPAFSAGVRTLDRVFVPAAEEPARREFFAMDTYMTFTAYGNGAEQALERAEEKMRTLESEWSVTDENSEIYRLNHSGGTVVSLGDDTAAILKFALDMAAETDGRWILLFIPFCGPGDLPRVKIVFPPGRS